VRVLRAKKGDKVEIADTGELYLCEIKSLEPLELTVLESLYKPKPLPFTVVLAFALLKGGHDELVLQKGTELGVNEFAPYISSRTIVRLDQKDKEKRQVRFEKIVQSSCEQCKRIDIPKVDGILSFDKMTDMQFDHAFFAYEGLSHESFNLAAEAAKVKQGERVLLIVGPEGGFDEKEVALATKKGLTPVSLGQRILRAETASIYMASVFSFLGESKE
jgi:16S rRNA (uracil1498-N3)-methyltransferase